MNPYVLQANHLFRDPKEAWLWSLAEREKNPDPDLANAEHYLWNRWYASQGPLEAAGAFITPFGYFVGKKAGLLSGRSPASLEQLKMGLLGAYEGL